MILPGCSSEAESSEIIDLLRPKVAILFLYAQVPRTPTQQDVERFAFEFTSELAAKGTRVLVFKEKLFFTESGAAQ